MILGSTILGSSMEFGGFARGRPVDRSQHTRSEFAITSQRSDQKGSARLGLARKSGQMRNEPTMFHFARQWWWWFGTRREGESWWGFVDGA